MKSLFLKLLSKKGLAILLSVLATVGVGLGVASLAGAFDNPSDSSSQFESSNSSTAQSSTEKDELTVVERESSIDLISSNFNEVTLKNVYLLIEGDTSIIQNRY